MKVLSKIFLFGLLVQLISCSSDEDPAPAPTPVQVNADFTVNATSIEAGEILSFSDQSTGNPVSWTWTFDGGNPATSTDQNPTVQYPSEGTYDVILSVNNSNTNDTETKAGYITVTARTIPDEFDIVGTWERAESNNPSLDGMQVTVVADESEGKIISSPSSSFPVDELKWRAIEKISEHEYVFEDRFSDGTYDESSIFILAYGTELIIGNFNASVAGSFQRWKRVDFQYPEDEDFSLADIWERTKSNNPSLDGMKVEVDPNQTEGVITKTPDSNNFPLGATKWNDIQKEGANRFVLDDLVSDGTLVESRIFIVGKGSEVILGGFAVINGSFQRWTREL